MSPRTLSLLLFVLIACTRDKPVVDAGRPDQLTGVVRDEKGAKANATLRLLSVTPATCLCGDESENCNCPASLADHQRRAAACPAQPLASATSNEKGDFALAMIDGGNLLYAASPGLARFQPVDARDNLSLQLEPTHGLEVTVTAPDLAVVTVTALFDNGWCRKLDRKDAVFTADDLPNDEVIVLVEAPKLTPVVFFSSPGTREHTATLRSKITVTGNCPRKNLAAHLVRWVSSQEKREVVANASGDFRFENVYAVDAHVECSVDGTTLEEWHFDAESNELMSTTGVSNPGDECHDVLVVNKAGVPIENAEVEASHEDLTDQDFGSGGHLFYTDKKGHACVDADFLMVTPPALLGGACAGIVNTKVSGDTTKVTLAPKSMKTVKWRGRVVDSDGAPIAKAQVQARGVGGDKDCEIEINDGAETRSDGTFELQAVPAGPLELAVTHRWYAKLEATVKVPSPSQDLVMKRGASWSGRVLGPKGPLGGSRLGLTDASGRTDHLVVSSDGTFSFRGLTPGVAKLQANIGDELMVGRRVLLATQTIVADTELKQDLVLPAGATIGGHIVSDGGTPMPKFVEAMPEGTRPLVNQSTHDSVSVPVTPDGRFVLIELPAGRWKLRAPPYFHWVTVETGTVDLALPAK